MQYKFFIIFLLIVSNSFSQDFFFLNGIGDFKNASSFSINSTGFLFITDSETDEIYKIDTLGNIIKDTGGYGWDENQFDNPVNVFATPLKVYICDKNNHRVEIFDKDLNFISQINTRESNNEAERFGYPLSCTVSKQGDLFILDSENNRIIKFDLFGNFVQNFGGFDAGKFMLVKPTGFSISNGNNIFVIDKNKIVIFDQYGNGISSIDLSENPSGINIVFNNLTINSERNIYSSNLSSEFSLKKLKLDIDKNLKIVSSLIFNDKLYVLTPRQILIYKKFHND